MKAAFPLTDKTYLAPDFSKSNLIGIYDGSTQKLEYISLSEKDEQTDLSSVFKKMIAQNVTVVISPFFNFMSLRVFRENNIQTLKSEGKSISFNLNLLIHNQLKSFDAMEAFNSGGCGSSCSSCTTTCKVG